MTEERIASTRITSIRINWYDIGMHCLEGTGQWRLSVYRNRRAQLYTTLDGCGSALKEEKYLLNDCQREDIFSYLEEIDADGTWLACYNVPAFDGFVYDIRLTYSDRHVRKITGSALFPPRWNELLSKLRAMCDMPLDGACGAIDWLQDGDEADPDGEAFGSLEACPECGRKYYDGKCCRACGFNLRTDRIRDIACIYGPPPFDLKGDD